MCGRYASTRSGAQLAAIFDAEDETDGQLAESYNVAPTAPVPIVRRTGHRGVDVARWGLRPPWLADAKAAARMINARVETVRTARAYRTAYAKRRCLVPADGWYEWRRNPDTPGKQPFYLARTDGEVLAFAGLWEYGREAGLTFTVLTMPALGGLAEIHDRMPLVLSPRRWAGWLGEAELTDEELLAPPGEDTLSGLSAVPVSAAVGNVRNDGPELREPVKPERPAPVDLTLF